jgi:hypothetical protein
MRVAALTLHLAAGAVTGLTRRVIRRSSPLARRQIPVASVYLSFARAIPHATCNGAREQPAIYLWLGQHPRRAQNGRSLIRRARGRSDRKCWRRKCASPRRQARATPSSMTDFDSSTTISPKVAIVEIARICVVRSFSFAEYPIGALTA